MTTQKKVLYIGGHGKIGLLALPKLAEAGHDVSALIRNPDQQEEIRSLGATPVLEDLTKLTVDQWAELFGDYDTVVWGAGNGGKGSADVTWAVDRDGALATIDALEKRAEAGDKVPAYIMISYVGATENETDPDQESWYAYVESKKAVDNRLNSSKLNYLILGPSELTDEPAGGVSVLSSPKDVNDRKTSRELVAEVVTQVVGKDELPASPLEFVDGDEPVSSL